MKEFNHDIVANPRIFCENRIEAHSDHRYFRTMEELEDNKSSFRFYLNGLWKFHYAKNYDCVIKGFEEKSYSCKGWDEIMVPANIQMQGYDLPQYANVQYPWDGREEINPGEIPTEFNPVASYVKYFNLPNYMENEKIFISFQGAESGMALWLNGKYIGYSEDSFTPSEFELTPYLESGENKLAVQVFKWTAGSWCEDQDFFRFSGIFRDVYIYSIPEVHVADINIETILDDEYKNAMLTIKLQSTKNAKINIVLKDKEKEVIRKNDIDLLMMTEYNFELKNVKLWSAENPYLYDLYLEVKSDDKVTEVIRQGVGFRRFELKNNVMHLNGKRIVFKGVNRHEFSATNGRAITKAEIIKDLITMKRNNINAIRTSHYPNSTIFYALCDEYGMYIIDETNLETHGMWEAIIRGLEKVETALPGDREDWKDLILDRANSMYQRDKNHPCILIWSCGNESYGGSSLYEMSNQFRKLDKTRLVHYEGIFNDRRYNGTSDMESQMYTPAADIEKFLTEHRDKPFICCEYAHAMGNSCGALHKYTDLTDKEMLYQGGFIWDYIDQSITKKDRYGNKFQAYGGDFSDRPCDFNFSGNGIVYGENRDASPKMQEVKYNYQNISIDINIETKTATIKNKNLFTNTNEFEAILTVEKGGILKDKKSIPAKELDIAPLTEKTIKLPIELFKDYGTYTVTLSFLLKEDTKWAERGHEVAFGQKIYEKKAPEIACTKPIEVVHGRLNIGVKGENFDALFSMNFGGLVSYRYGGVEMLKSIPKPNFWRAPIDNDAGNNMMARYGQWKLASMYLSNKSSDGGIQVPPKLEEHESYAVITYKYVLPTRPVAACDLSYTVYGDGTIKTKLTYKPVEELGDMPEFGVIFKVDADYDRLEWFGMGPDSTYVDRCHGAKLGIYHNQVKDNIAKYLVPQECGNKIGVRYAKITDKKGRGLMISGENLSFSALPYTPHEIENAMHMYELPPVHYTVIKVSKQQMGVGGDNSWGAKTHTEYLIDISEKLEFEFSFKGI